MEKHHNDSGAEQWTGMLTRCHKMTSARAESTYVCPYYLILWHFLYLLWTGNILCDWHTEKHNRSTLPHRKLMFPGAKCMKHSQRPCIHFLHTRWYFYKGDYVVRKQVGAVVWQQKAAHEFDAKCPQFKTPNMNWHSMFISNLFLSDSAAESSRCIQSVRTHKSASLI